MAKFYAVKARSFVVFAICLFFFSSLFAASAEHPNFILEGIHFECAHCRRASEEYCEQIVGDRRTLSRCEDLLGELLLRARDLHEKLIPAELVQLLLSNKTTQHAHLALEILLADPQAIPVLNRQYGNILRRYGKELLLLLRNSEQSAKFHSLHLLALWFAVPVEQSSLNESLRISLARRLPEIGLSGFFERTIGNAQHMEPGRIAMWRAAALQIGADDWDRQLEVFQGDLNRCLSFAIGDASAGCDLGKASYPQVFKSYIEQQQVLAVVKELQQKQAWENFSLLRKVPKTMLVKPEIRNVSLKMLREHKQWIVGQPDLAILVPIFSMAIIDAEVSKELQEIWPDLKGKKDRLSLLLQTSEQRQLLLRLEPKPSKILWSLIVLAFFAALSVLLKSFVRRDGALSLAEQRELESLLQFFQLSASVKSEALTKVYRQRAKFVHPDGSAGSSEQFHSLSANYKRARELLLKRAAEA